MNQRSVLALLLLFLYSTMVAQEPCDIEAVLGFTVDPIICESEINFEFGETGISTTLGDPEASNGAYSSTYVLSNSGGEFVSPLAPSATIDLNGVPAGYYCLQQLIAPQGDVNGFSTADDATDLEELADGCVSISECDVASTFYRHIVIDVSHEAPYCNGDGSWSVDITINNANSGAFLFDPNGFYASDKLFENGVTKTVTTYSESMICILPIDVTAADLLGEVVYDEVAKSYDVPLPDDNLLEALNQCNEILFIYPPECASCVDSTLIVPNPGCDDVYAPVCGCDGMTYDNACIAEKIGGQVSWSEGTCHDECVDEEVIDADIACFGILETVCGCNGEEYENACIAEYKHGVLEWSEGPCPEICYDSELQNPDVNCLEIFAPVCGCDGLNYYNGCEATYLYGIHSYTAGPCEGGGALARDDEIETVCGTLVSIPIFDNDLLIDGASICHISYPPYGEVIMAEELQFVPVEGFTGMVEIEYTICTDYGGSDASVTIHVLHAEETLEPTIGTYEVATSSHIQLPETSLQGFDLTEWNICELGEATVGSVVLANGGINYLGEFDYSGPDSFVCTYCKVTECGEVFLDVICELLVSADCPDEIPACAEPITPTEICVDFCDLPEAAIVDVTALWNCSLSIASDLCFTYTALPGFVGQEQLTVVGEDTFGQIDTTYVNLIVQENCDGGSLGTEAGIETPRKPVAQKPAFNLSKHLEILTKTNSGIHLSKNDASDIDELFLFDLYGELIWRGRIADSAIQYINLGSMPSGVYLLQFFVDGKSYTEKIMY